MPLPSFPYIITGHRTDWMSMILNATFCYGAGLRVSELVHLRVRDIDSDREVLHIRQGKGARDRELILTPGLLRLLRCYWQRYRPHDALFYGKDIGSPASTPSRWYCLMQSFQQRCSARRFPEGIVGLCRGRTTTQCTAVGMTRRALSRPPSAALHCFDIEPLCLHQRALQRTACLALHQTISS